MNKIFWIIVIFLSVNNILFAHKEQTHEYIVNEAYKLLVAQIGYEIPVMEQYALINDLYDKGARYNCTLCNTFDGIVGGCKDEFWAPPFKYGSIAAGAWAEDWQDFIYNKHNCLTVSTSHFWNADGGKNERTFLTLETFLGNFSIIDESDNAYMKAMKYINGDWMPWDGLNSDSGVYFTYNGLIDLYKTGHVKLVSSFQVIAGVRLTTRNLGYQEITLSTANKNRIVFNILGRVAHLLGDMSSNPHTHNTQHGYPGDFYENISNVNKYSDFTTQVDNVATFLGGKYINGNFSRLYKTGGGIVDPYKQYLCLQNSTENAIWFLMQTTNQICDHFADMKLDGDNVIFPSDKVGELRDKIKLSELGDLTSSAIYRSLDKYKWDDLMKVVDNRDATIPYAIRATSGLLYWFAKEAGLLYCTNGVYNTSVALSPSKGFPNEVHLRGNTYEFQSGFWLSAGMPKDQITPHSFVIESGAEVEMHAENVLLCKNFSAILGSKVHVYPEGCQYGCGYTATTTPAPNINLNKQTEEEIPTNPELKITLNENRTLANGAKYKEETRSKEFTIEAYPNPISKKTKIEYTVPIKSTLDIKITNIKGEEIKKIITESKHDQGKYEIEWNIENEANGVYYCVLSSGGKQYVKTLIISK